ncbi:hypothetical protein BJ170DRAFT_678881 [Xylariales sp. AK1849]|nr:hypothetical protein BJ170DRAFT_678881 [Xylariales sp. AK1849]
MSKDRGRREPLISQPFVTLRRCFSAKYSQGKIPQTLKMQTALISLVALAAIARGFIITDCVSGQVTNFGDDKCQIWTAADFTFQSDAGCTLSVYSEGNCQGSIFTTATQNQCQTAPDGAVSINCVT